MMILCSARRSYVAYTHSYTERVYRPLYVMLMHTDYNTRIQCSLCTPSCRVLWVSVSTSSSSALMPPSPAPAPAHLCRLSRKCVSVSACVYSPPIQSRPIHYQPYGFVPFSRPYITSVFQQRWRLAFYTTPTTTHRRVWHKTCEKKNLSESVKSLQANIWIPMMAAAAVAHCTA